MTQSASLRSLPNSGKPDLGLTRSYLAARNLKTAGRFLTFLLTVILAGNPVSAQDQPLRTWKDSSGKFSVEARFVESAEGRVKLQKADGSSLSIDISRLSQVDKDYISALPSRPGGEKPAIKIGEISTDNFRIVSIDRQPKWSMKAQPSPMATGWSTKPVVLKFPSKSGEAEDRVGALSPALSMPDIFAVGNQRSPNWLLYRKDFSLRKTGGLHQGVSINLQDGVQTAAFQEAPGSAMSTAVDPSDLILACIVWSNFEHHATVFENREGRIHERSSLAIADSMDMADSFRVPFTLFCGSRHLLVCAPSEGGTLTGCCDLVTAKMVWAVRHTRGTVPMVTPDEKSVLIPFDGGIACLDRDSGDQTGWVSVGRVAFEALCLMPDGKRLVAAARDRVAVLDFETGALQSFFGTYSASPSLGPATSDIYLDVYPVNDRRVAMVRRSIKNEIVVLADLDKRCTVCSYNFPVDSECKIDGMGNLRFIVAKDSEVVWDCLPLPHPEAAAEIEASLEQFTSFSFPAGVALSGKFLVPYSTIFHLPGDATGPNRQGYVFTEGIDYTARLRARLDSLGIRNSSSGEGIFVANEYDENRPAGRRDIPAIPGLPPGALSPQGPPPVAPGIDGKTIVPVPAGSSGPSRNQGNVMYMDSLPADAEIIGNSFDFGGGIGNLTVGNEIAWVPCFRYSVQLAGIWKNGKFEKSSMTVGEILDAHLVQIDPPDEINHPAGSHHYRLDQDTARGLSFKKVQ